MRILGIESSCDDCCLAIVENGRHIICEIKYQQHELHKKYNGVVPEIAARAHVEFILNGYKALLTDAKQSVDSISAIAVTTHPGLYSSLVVGISFASSLAYALMLPLISVNHMLAHLYSIHLSETVPYPHVGAVISGGHTHIGIAHSYDHFEVIGKTVDDACGEAFDKVAVYLGLGYPGGPKIEQYAREGNPHAARLPDVMANSYNLSYSGLKSAIIHQRDKFWHTDDPQIAPHIAATFQKHAVDMLMKRIDAIATSHGISHVVIGGGVAANEYFRTSLMSRSIYHAHIHAAMIAGIAHKYMDNNSNIKKPLMSRSIYHAHIPPRALCTDNAAMIAGIAHKYMDIATILCLIRRTDGISDQQY